MLNRAISYLALAALCMAACQGRKENDKPSAEAVAVEAAKTAEAPASAVPPKADPFAEKIAANLARVPDPQVVIPEGITTLAELDNGTFRDRVIGFVRQVAAGGDKVTCELSAPAQKPYRTIVSAWQPGTLAGRAEAADPTLCTALKEATRRAVAAAGGDGKALASARFAIELPELHYELVEHDGKGVELSHGLVPVRTLDKALLARRIEEGKAYLLRVINPERKGVHKYYHAPADQLEPTLHTIYTASTIYTMLRLYARDKDKRLLETMKSSAEFLLSMQNRDKNTRGYGGFYYTFNLQEQQPEPKLVVGTTSKTIFTLLDLHALTKDKKYLDNAILAANWLTSMQQPDGRVRSYLRQKSNGQMSFSKKESMLYTGQVLSALSRIYAVTREQRYLDAAARTATYLASKVGSDGCYLGDDYRKPNPISSSWVILSLFDFTRATDDPRFQDIVFRCADELLTRQIRKDKDAYRYGRWEGSLSSSGNGWLAEVYSELYLYCKAKGMSGCDRFEKSVVRVIRLLMQYTYTPEGAYVVKNPAMAMGGVFWNVDARYVRTDSVCHAMNAYLNMIDHLPDGVLVEVPEPPLGQRLGLVAGAGDDSAEAEAQTNERDDEVEGDPEDSAQSPEENAE